MHVNGSATPSLTLNSTTLTTNSIACTGTTSNTTPTVQGVFMGVTTDSYGNTDLCGTNGAYIDFTIPNNNYKGRMHYVNASRSFVWFVNCSASGSMTLNATFLVVNGTTLQSSDKRLKYYENHLLMP